MEENKQGILYLVSTPIGNLKDITLRALEILKSCDLILAEDTRVSAKLLNHYEIKKKMMPLHKFNELEKASYIKKLLEEGNNLALISDAGSPLVSDPGIFLIPELLKDNHKIIPIPGASAILPAVQLSGMVKDKFLFLGFFPNSNKELDELLELINKLDGVNLPLFFYESPHKINKTLEKLLEIFGDIKVVIFREITKKFEERIEDNVSNLIDRVFKGEIVLSFEINSEEKISELDKNIIDFSRKYAKMGFSKKDCAKILAVQLNEKKNKIYKILLENGEE
jgi:16S rRNA (cytidine1402-2'-O)-methyltransferase